MIRYAATIFLSAFLLFQVQPMVARFILPWFGGTSLVWTTCMLFFQVVLVLGYSYSHLITRRLVPHQQWLLHTVLLLVALMLLPVRPEADWKPADGNFPTTRILILLSACIGLPFFLLSTTGPLIQAWQSKTHPHRSPFRLFALSNAGSLLALLSYPFIFERFFSLDAQSATWSLAFAGFAALACFSGWQYRSLTQLAVENRERALAAQHAREDAEAPPPSWPRIFQWLVLTMIPSVLLLATTNLMTQEVGSIPFLWILPLSLYLLSFIICFEHPRWYFRPLFFALLFLSATFSAFLLEAGPEATLVAQIVGYSLACFASAMCCHGELSRLKPSYEHLTLFYLLVAIGGALGGIFVAIVAPRIFVNFYEFQLGLIAALVFSIFAYGYHVRGSDKKNRMGHAKLIGYATTLFFGLISVWIVSGSLFSVWLGDNAKSVISKTRNEYGTLTVKNYTDWRKLYNGRIEHGFQANDELQRMVPTSYYGIESGLGVAIDFLQNRDESAAAPLEFGAIGLGVGTICGWGRPQDRIRFYEINRAVQLTAEEHFYYLSETPAKVEIVIGDARVQLERELLAGDQRKFDVLVADAFSSDSIPIHLLTLESFRLYKQRLTPRGVIAVHTSNRFLELANVAKRLAEEIGMQSVIIDHSAGDNPFYNSSTWVLVTNNQAFLNDAQLKSASSDWPDERYSAFWTDDYASIVPLVQWSLKWEWFKELISEKFERPEGDE